MWLMVTQKKIQGKIWIKKTGKKGIISKRSSPQRYFNELQTDFIHPEIKKHETNLAVTEFTENLNQTISVGAHCICSIW